MCVCRTAPCLMCDVGTVLRSTSREPVFFTAVKKVRGTFCFSPDKKNSEIKRGTWCEGEHRSAACSVLPTLPCSLSLCWPIVLWDWSSSRLLQTGLGAPVAPVILCGFRECYCSLADLWSFNYPTTRWLPGGGGREQRKNV